jgi:hypothetical protein
MDNPLIALRKEFGALARHLRDLTSRDVTATGWTSVFLDVRYKPSRTIWATKVEATVAGLPVSLNVSSTPLEDLLSQIGKTQIGEPFYGFVLTLSAEGEVDVQLNYDPKCFSDLRFWTID